MTDKQDAQTTPQATKGQPKANKAAAPKLAQKSATGGRMAGILALLALLLAAYTSYQVWLTNQQLANLQQASQQQASVQESLAGEVSRAGAEVVSLKSSWQQQKQTLAKQQQNMDVALQEALQQMAQTQNQSQQQLPKWELAEAEYLLRLANQRLAMEQNPAAVITLLQAADEIMRSSEQVGGYLVRQAIATDIGALSSVSVVDVEGVYARLAGLLEQSLGLNYIAVIPLKAAEENTAADAINEEKPAETLTWDQKAWQVAGDLAEGTWQELQSLVRIQERTNADQWLLSPDMEVLLAMRLQLGLTQAQAALLRGQQDIYQSSLAQVASLLHDYYRHSDPVVQAMQAQITQLSQIQLLTEMPDISSSLYALQDLQAAIYDQQGE
ncbi:MAG: uroporphyrinogen-III C-methyltransferase [Pseudomonadales bacterium]|jgi:uroporphyrin-3 C-methyltransferase